MERSRLNECFTLLKPVCDDVMTCPTKDNIKQLQDLLDHVPPYILQAMQQYLMFPLQLHLMNNQIKKETKIHVINCLTFILSKTYVDDLQLLWNVYTNVFKMIFNISQSEIVIDKTASEELKLSVLLCTAQVLRSAKSHVLMEVYKKKNILRMSHGVYVCVKIISQEKMKHLRLAAISNIMVHFYVEDIEFSDISLRHQIADVMVHLMPGVLDTLCKAARDNPIEGHKIKLMGIRAWGRILWLIFEDRAVEDSLPEEITWHISESNDYKTKYMEDDKKGLAEGELSSQWITSALTNIQKHAEYLSILQNDENWKVRLELASVCDLIISSCSRNLGKVIHPLLEVALAATEDEVEEVVASGKRVLLHSSLLANCSVENFFNFSSRLQLIFRTAGESEQLMALKIMCGYLKLISQSAQHIFCSAAHLKKVISSLICCSQLDTSHISILDDGFIPEIDSNTIAHMNKNQWKTFHYISSFDVSTKLEEVCFLLGKVGDLEVLVYYLLDQFSGNLNRRKELTFILNQILSGGLSKNCDKSLEVVRTVLNVFFEPETWTLPFSVLKDVTLGQAQSNVVQCCLMVEGVGRMAEAIGTSFKKLLLKSLYLILEYAGSHHSLLAAAGGEALRRISYSCGNGDDVAALIRENIDYLCFHISRKLAVVDRNPKVLNVLKMVLQYSDPEILPRLQDIVIEVMNITSSTYLDSKITSLLQTFHAVIACLGRWYGTSLNDVSNDDNVNKKLAFSDIFDKLLEYHKCRKVTFEDDSVTDSEDCEKYNECDNESTVPPHVTLTLDILNRCLHFLPSKNRTHQLLVLQTLSTGMLVLSKYPNQLLPCVHSLWSPLVGRFSPKSDPVVVRQSFVLLKILATVAEDFIRSRTIKEVMPDINHFLRSSILISKKKASSPAYLFTQTFKLQKEILCGLGSIVVHLKLPERELDGVLTSVIGYLSNQQPKPLQDSCVDLLKEVSLYDEDAVWFKLSGFLSSSNVHNPGLSEDNLHYQNNIKLIMESLSAVD